MRYLNQLKRGDVIIVDGRRVVVLKVRNGRVSLGIDGAESVNKSPERDQDPKQLFVQTA